MKTYSELTQEIKDLETKLEGLKNDLQNRGHFVLMKQILKGKPTFQLHPQNQETNLERNGWEKINVAQFLVEMKYYNIK